MYIKELQQVFAVSMEEKIAVGLLIKIYEMLCYVILHHGQVFAILELRKVMRYLEMNNIDSQVQLVIMTMGKSRLRFAYRNGKGTFFEWKHLDSYDAVEWIGSSSVGDWLTAAESERE